MLWICSAKAPKQELPDLLCVLIPKVERGSLLEEAGEGGARDQMRLRRPLSLLLCRPGVRIGGSRNLSEVGFQLRG